MPAGFFYFPPLKTTAHLQWKLEVDMLCQTKTRKFKLDISHRNGFRVISTIAGRRKSQKRCSMTDSFLWLNSTN
nr:MAG TPA: hypothetical protein [Caudoviricetes sp.]